MTYKPTAEKQRTDSAIEALEPLRELYASAELHNCLTAAAALANCFPDGQTRLLMGQLHAGIAQILEAMDGTKIRADELDSISDDCSEIVQA